jgi:hypothetical protein
LHASVVHRTLDPLVDNRIDCSTTCHLAVIRPHRGRLECVADNWCRLVNHRLSVFFNGDKLLLLLLKTGRTGAELLSIEGWLHARLLDADSTFAEVDLARLAEAPTLCFLIILRREEVVDRVHAVIHPLELITYDCQRLVVHNLHLSILLQH